MDKRNESTQTVLVVDDEPMVREVVCAYLRREGFETVEAEAGPAALEMVAEVAPTLIILDVMLPGLDGYSVLTQLRRHTDVPVILLTARSEEVDRVLGLELGADDYVVKPFSPRELAARVRSVLRRVTPAQGLPSHVEHGGLVLDRSARTVLLDGASIDMPPLEFDLLFHLASSPMTVFSRGELLEAVWGSSSDWQDPSTVTVHVRRLRQKVEADPDDPRRIVTVWGRGYRFEP